ALVKGNGEQERAARFQDAQALGQCGTIVGDMLEHVEAEDVVERRVVESQFGNALVPITGGRIDGSVGDPFAEIFTAGEPRIFLPEQAVEAGALFGEEDPGVEDGLEEALEEMHARPHTVVQSTIGTDDAFPPVWNLPAFDHAAVAVEEVGGELLVRPADIAVTR